MKIVKKYERSFFLISVKNSVHSEGMRFFSYAYSQINKRMMHLTTHKSFFNCLRLTYGNLKIHIGKISCDTLLLTFSTFFAVGS